jgi:hypothetical protein
MLTDDEIRDLKALTRFADRHSVFTCDPQTIHELATRLLSAEAKMKVLEEALETIANGWSGMEDLAMSRFARTTGGEQMNEEDRTLETVVKMLSTCIEQRDTFKRERDEARIGYHELVKVLVQEQSAEARGYRRGVEDAADEAERGGNSVEIRDAILALLEKEKR